MLELKNITKKFGSRTILNKLNLTIPDQEILAIVGPSGAGKTTLLRCLSGLEKVDSGQFLWNNQEFDPTEPSKDNQITGVVFQSYELFPNLTIIYNITLAPRLVLKEDNSLALQTAKQLLHELDLTGKEELYPYQLSGGQKLRVAIARALDPALRTKVSEIILQLKNNNKMPQIIVTHDMDFAHQVAIKFSRSKR